MYTQTHIMTSLSGLIFLIFFFHGRSTTHLGLIVKPQYPQSRPRWNRPQKNIFHMIFLSTHANSWQFKDSHTNCFTTKFIWIDTNLWCKLHCVMAIHAHRPSLMIVFMNLSLHPWPKTFLAERKWETLK